jgi:hypothetical protein
MEVQGQVQAQVCRLLLRTPPGRPSTSIALDQGAPARAAIAASSRAPQKPPVRAAAGRTPLYIDEIAHRDRWPRRRRLRTAAPAMAGRLASLLGASRGASAGNGSGNHSNKRSGAEGGSRRPKRVRTRKPKASWRERVASAAASGPQRFKMRCIRRRRRMTRTTATPATSSSSWMRSPPGAMASSSICSRPAPPARPPRR